MFKKLVDYKIRKAIEVGLGEPVEEWWEKYILEGFLWDTLSNFRKFIRFTKRLIIWVPLLYKIENWDFKYLLDVMLLQLRDLQKSPERICAAKDCHLSLEHSQC